MGMAVAIKTEHCPLICGGRGGQHKGPNSPGGMFIRAACFSTKELVPATQILFNWNEESLLYQWELVQAQPGRVFKEETHPTRAVPVDGNLGIEPVLMTAADDDTSGLLRMIQRTGIAV